MEQTKSNVFIQGLRVIIGIMLIVFSYTIIDKSITYFIRNDDEIIKLTETDTKRDCAEYISKISPNKEISTIELNQCIQETNDNIMLYKKTNFNDTLRFNIIGIIISIIGYIVFVKLEDKKK